MKLRHLSVLFGLLCVSTAHAGTAKYGGEFMSTGIGARALGMGGAFVSIADDASAGYWNPAGMIYVQRREIILMHSERFGDLVNYDAGSFVQQLAGKDEKRAAFGFSFLRVGVDDIDKTDLVLVDGAPQVISTSTFSETDWAFLVSYARLWNNMTSLGGSVKVVRKALDDESATGFGFDVGVLMKPWRRLSLGLSIQDVTSTFLIWDNETENILPLARLGISYPLLLDSVKGRLTLAAGLDVRFEGRKTATAYWIGESSADLRLGAEYWYDDLIAVRTGIEQHEEVDFMAGAGLRLPFGAQRLGLDYAFLSNGHDLDDTHRVSGSLLF